MDQTIIPILLMLTLFKITNALKVPIIHPNSPESPLYIKNLTRQQRIEYFLQHSSNRTRIISNFTNLAVTTPQEIYVKHGSLLLIKSGVGTFESPIPYETFYFTFDTGSEQNWLQCEECQHYGGCFGTPPIYFRNSESSSYRPIPCDSHELCYSGQCVDGYCSYNVNYRDQQTVHGVLAYESFTFGVGRERDENDESNFNLVFGCNRVHQGLWINEGYAGMLGFSWGERSVVHQLVTQRVIDRNIFSYCFPHYDNTELGARGYLQIGTVNDNDNDHDYKSTDLVKYKGDTTSYFILLKAISLAGTRLPIDPFAFPRLRNRGEGTTIDTGTMFSEITKDAFTVLTRYLVNYFSSLGDYRRVSPGPTDFNLKLCYQDLRRREDLLPSITFHLAGADLELEPDNVFIFLYPPRRDVFCLAMNQNSRKLTTLGAYQQSNFKFVFDRANGMLHFKKEYC